MPHLRFSGDEINFCHFFMIVSFCILTDVDLMYSEALLSGQKALLLQPHGHWTGSIFIKICDFVIFTIFK